ncbi:MAG: hypothetical protein KZY61_07570 [Clostridiaceae bacterium]|nr:hypothetical protein [Clostridiaceae bacterium]MBW4860590.1 hypothetical protein [Clostridiaceae bacterium]MBW4868506.1 hypothetical protein [Clostridiaceae bacterium]
MKEKNIIYILLTYSGSLLSKCINIYTKEPYSHVSIALDIDLNELYSFGRLKPSNPIFGGFVKEDIFNGTYARFPNTRCALYSLEVNEIQYNKLKKELQKFKLNKHMYGYNLLGLFGVILNKPIERKYNYFCSQFVSAILNNSGICLFNKSPALVSPRDFRKCKELELVYEGRLKRYGYRQEYFSEVYQQNIYKEGTL